MSKRKLLLADDSMTIQKVVNLTFADEGIEVFTVGNGSQAIEKLSEVKPDLVLADVHMPGLTGYEVCEQIRKNPQFEHVPVMLLVGSFEPFDEQEAQRVGASDYLTKPFQSIRQLIQKVTVLLGDSKDDNNEARNESAAATDVAGTLENQQTKSDVSQDFQNDFGENVPDKPAILSQNNFDPLATQPVSFGDAALDDEMIETNSASNFADNFAAPLSSSSRFDVETAGEIKTTKTAENTGLDGNWANDKNAAAESAAVTPETHRTEPLSYDDIQDMNASMQTSAAALVEAETQKDWQIFEFDANVAAEQSASPDFAQTLPSDAFEQNQFVQESDQEFNLELDDSPVSQQASFQETKMNPVSDLEFVNGAEAQSVEARAEEKEFSNSHFSNVSEARASENEPLELDLDEINLLQIDDDDAILDLQTEEPMLAETSIPNVEIMPRTQNMAPAAARNFGESANNALSQAANQAVSTMNLDFPPQVIEAIAQLVVEKLSDKVIEKIAWEIVPDRFDLIVRKQMDNRNR